LGLAVHAVKPVEVDGGKEDCIGVIIRTSVGEERITDNEQGIAGGPIDGIFGRAKSAALDRRAEKRAIGHFDGGVQRTEHDHGRAIGFQEAEAGIEFVEIDEISEQGIRGIRVAALNRRGASQCQEELLRRFDGFVAAVLGSPDEPESLVAGVFESFAALLNGGVNDNRQRRKNSEQHQKDEPNPYAGKDR
jgi:hypothetical protein